MIACAAGMCHVPAAAALPGGGAEGRLRLCIWHHAAGGPVESSLIQEADATSRLSQGIMQPKAAHVWPLFAWDS